MRSICLTWTSLKLHPHFSIIFQREVLLFFLFFVCVEIPQKGTCYTYVCTLFRFMLFFPCVFFAGCVVPLSRESRTFYGLNHVSFLCVYLVASLYFLCSLPNVCFQKKNPKIRDKFCSFFFVLCVPFLLSLLYFCSLLISQSSLHFKKKSVTHKENLLTSEILKRKLLLLCFLSLTTNATK